ncbi:MAG: DNA helicase RecQ [Cryomorphaceae bacterium]|nr:DNA helicase RecQ [Cryomorphaceae bacterium]
MTAIELEPKEALKKFFGFDGFKGEQEAIVKSVLAGQDTFVIMPTGGGKSMCYQLPALMSEGTAIVVSPLIALMKNQVDAIRGFSEEEGVAHFLNSSLNKSDIQRVKDDVTAGKTKLLYVAPESLTKEENVNFLHSVKISFVAIDEAHCISEWGHDFRPEYRRLKSIIQQISDVPIIALTATATPKVQQDIQKNLGMTDARLYKSSFNRANLYYEVRPKKEAVKQIIQYVRQNEGKSGIIYCLSRKKVEEIAQTLQVNGVKALPYHAGMDGNQRSRVQDQFLMQDVDIIVATIAFGMGIDKPDVRFVIHYDMPKSIESYYQETGRAGRDGGEGVCIAFYSYKDIEKLEKFLHGKPIAEQEIGMQLINEIVAYAETSMSRRKFILHYFGEDFDEVNGPGAEMDDNSRFPRERYEGSKFIQVLLKTVLDGGEVHKSAYIVNVLTGKMTSEVQTYRGNESAYWEAGSAKDDKFWHAVTRQSVVNGYLKKEIESYGTLRVTEKGLAFLKSPHEIMLIQERDFSDVDDKDTVVSNNRQNGAGALDQDLLAMLRDLRKKVAKEKSVPPYVVFQDPSLEEIATHYPISIDELTMISGVGRGKAMKFGQPFIAMIKKHVEENDIDRAQDMTVKTIVNKSGAKVNIIQNIDRKLPLEDIAKALGKELGELIEEIETIVASGTKINIDYYLDELLDEDSQGDIFEYFMEAETDSLESAVKEFDGDYTEDELRLMRIKFMSEVAN